MKRALVLALLALLVVAPSAYAHARLERTVPAENSDSQTAPKAVSFYFNETIEANFGALRVYDAGGNEVEVGSPYRPEGNDHALAIALAPNLPDGTYTATFRIISADSHPVAGTITFAVGDPNAGGTVAAKRVIPPPQASTGRVTTTAFWLDRFLGYLALGLALGIPFFVAVSWWRTLADSAGGGDEWLSASNAFDHKVRWLVGGAVVTGATVSLLALPLEAANAAGASFWSALNSDALNEVLDTRFGALMTLRIAAWLLLGVLFAAISLRGRVGVMRTAELGATGLAPRRPISPELAALLMLPIGSLLISPALAGHARTQEYAWLLLPADVIHVAGMCLWLGGLVALAVALPAALRPLNAGDRARMALGALGRFSPIALGSVIALAATGTIQAIIEVGGISKLWDTGYGRMVVAKILLLLVLIALGAANRQRLLPALQKAVAAGVEPGRIRGFLERNVRVETALIGVVLAITAVLVAYAPATETAKPQPAVAATNPNAGKPSAGRAMVGPVLLRWTVDPGRVGSNQLNVFVRNPEGGASTRAKEVRVEMSLPSRGIAALKPTIEDLGAGHFVASGIKMTPAGKWTVAVTVRTSEFDEDTTTFQVPIG